MGLPSHESMSQTHDKISIHKNKKQNVTRQRLAWPMIPDDTVIPPIHFSENILQPQENNLSNSISENILQPQ